MARNPLGTQTLHLVAERFRLLGDPFRLRLLGTLAEREMAVGELAEATSATQANVSKQLKILLAAGLLGRRKQGLHVYYRITDPSVFQLCDLICGSIEERLERDLGAIRDEARTPARKGRRAN